MNRIPSRAADERSRLRLHAIVAEMVIRGAALAALAVLLTSGVALAQQASLAGTVRDQTGAPLPGVTVELTAPHNATLAAATDASGKYRFDRVVAGSYTLSFRLPNFADQR